MFQSVDIIPYITQFLCMDALLPDNSGISESLCVNMPNLVIYVINWTGMVHMYHPRGVCLLASIGVLLWKIHLFTMCLQSCGTMDSMIL